jgi:hypothetical protein
MAGSNETERSMPAAATRNLFIWASGFGVGAILILFAFVFLIGVGEMGRSTAPGPVAASQPATAPAPNTAGRTAPETTGRAAAPASASRRNRTILPYATAQSRWNFSS